MPVEGFVIGFVVVGKFAVSAVRNVGTFAIIPNKTAFGVRHFAGSFKIVIAAAITVTCGPRFFNKIVGISRH